MYHGFFIHSSVEGHLGGFHVLAVVNTASVNAGVHVSFSFGFLGYMPSGGIAGSCDAFIPSFLRTLRTVLHSGCYQFTFPPTVSVKGLPLLHTFS